MENYAQPWTSLHFGFAIFIFNFYFFNISLLSCMQNAPGSSYIFLPLESDISPRRFCYNYWVMIWKTKCWTLGTLVATRVLLFFWGGSKEMHARILTLCIHISDTIFYVTIKLHMNSYQYLQMMDITTSIILASSPCLSQISTRYICI